jgi:prephenate dehydrogenase
MTVQITVLGLGQVGASIGLALAGRKDQLLRVGNDRDPQTARAVEKLGAFDQIKFNLPSAIENADAVILAVPVDEIRKTFEEFVQDLKPGAVVIDTAPLKISVMNWVKELLPEGRYFVSMTPTLNPAYFDEPAAGAGAVPHADLFHNSLMVITALPGAEEEALKLVSDLAVMLGSSPFYADPWETDGLLAGARALPQLLAAALTNALVDQPGWLEARKLAGRSFAQVSAPVLELDEYAQLGHAALQNSENTLRVLDNLVVELSLLRQAIATQDQETLSGRLGHARQARLTWWNQRRSADWADHKAEPLPSSGNFFERMLGFRKPKKS